MSALRGRGTASDWFADGLCPKENRCRRRRDMGEEMRLEYILERIWGDYAILRAGDGTENQVALAFLPAAAEEGDRIVCEDLEYRIEK